MARFPQKLHICPKINKHQWSSQAVVVEVKQSCRNVEVLSSLCQKGSTGNYDKFLNKHQWNDVYCDSRNVVLDFQTFLTGFMLQIQRVVFFISINVTTNHDEE